MIDRISTLMERVPKETDAVLITSWINRKYFTGLKTSEGILVLTRKENYLFVDFRYIELAMKKVRGINVILLTKISKQLRQLKADLNLKTIGIDSGNMTVAEFIKYQAIFEGASLTFDNKISVMIEDMRRYKNQEEIESIKHAQFFAERAFYDIIRFIKPGKTEREIAARLDFVMKCSGSEGEAFPTMVSAGSNTSMPHSVPTDYKIKRGDLVIMDFGANYNSYCSDMTRTIAVGYISPEKQEVYNIVLNSQNLALKKIRPGASCHEIDAVARDYIAKRGYGNYFGHSLGHSLGLKIHEFPVFAPESLLSRCKVGHVMTVEPGIYIPSKFGVRIEDMVYIDKGGVKNLTNADKSLIIV